MSLFFSQVCDEALYSIRVRDKDSMVCCGSQLGTVRLLKMSPDLCTLQKNEKALVSEVRHEHNFLHIYKHIHTLKFILT